MSAWSRQTSSRFIVLFSHCPPTWCLEGTRWHHSRSRSEERDSHFFPPVFQISSAAETEAKTPSGLIKGHAYSVTGIDEVCPVVWGQGETWGKDKGVSSDLRWQRALSWGSYPNSHLSFPPISPVAVWTVCPVVPPAWPASAHWRCPTA